jgi:hypothetical protein
MVGGKMMGLGSAPEGKNARLAQRHRDLEKADHRTWQARSPFPNQRMMLVLYSHKMLYVNSKYELHFVEIFH